MSSPPPLGLTGQAHGRKRPSVAGLPSAKRRKPSTSSVASSQHPLRQTSFPPENQTYSPRDVSYSPVIEDSVSSIGRSTRGGRKAKNEARSTPGATSTVGGRGRRRGSRGATDAKSGGGNAAREEEEADDDDGDGGVDTMLEGGGKMDEAALKQEREHLAMLLEAFSPEQADRYDVWRRVKLKKETVRKITNQTLSQSVTAPIITTINGYTKIFIGELLERARDVQLQWLAATPTLATGEPNPAYQLLLSRSGPGCRFEERDRGPLTPDHLREALRRYKKDREGGSAGFQGASMQGKESVAARTGGKRLFR